jgi:hypothetical protein
LENTTRDSNHWVVVKRDLYRPISMRRYLGDFANEKLAASLQAASVFIRDGYEELHKQAGTVLTLASPL